MQQDRGEKRARDAHREIHEDAEEEGVDKLNARGQQGLPHEEVPGVQQGESAG